MGTEVPAGADEVVRAVARANKWIAAPSGDAALNALGLDTQMPAKLVYVSSGPYKRYGYGPYDIELRHRANRDLLDCSQTTCAIVQALKALGRENEGDGGNQNACAGRCREGLLGVPHLGPPFSCGRMKPVFPKGRASKSQGLSLGVSRAGHGPPAASAAAEAYSGLAERPWSTLR